MPPEHHDELRTRFLEQQQKSLDELADCCDPGAKLRELIRDLHRRSETVHRLRFPRPARDGDQPRPAA